MVECKITLALGVTIGHYAPMHEVVTSAFVVEPLAWPADMEIVVSFLTAHEWPFHGVPRLSPEEAAAVCVVADDIASFWIRDGDGDGIVGLIRVFDLDDLDDLDNGSPLFDLRIATNHRGRGIGRFAVDWLTAHLFTTC